MRKKVDGVKMIAFREQSGLKAKFVAAKAGIKKTTLYYYERNKRTPKIETLEKIAKMYGVSVTDLLIEE